jgi:hypothetical protein
LTLPVPGGHSRAFLSVPAGATVAARYPDGAPAAIVRRVGRGQVLALAAELMRPAVLDAPAGLIAFAGAVLEWRGARLGDPAWSYTLPGSPVPPRPPWRGSYAP